MTTVKRNNTREEYFTEAKISNKWAEAKYELFRIATRMTVLGIHLYKSKL
jgi:hypothetical protein